METSRSSGLPYLSRSWQEWIHTSLQNHKLIFDSTRVQTETLIFIWFHGDLGLHFESWRRSWICRSCVSSRKGLAWTMCEAPFQTFVASTGMGACQRYKRFHESKLILCIDRRHCTQRRWVRRQRCWFPEPRLTWQIVHVIGSSRPLFMDPWPPNVGWLAANWQLSNSSSWVHAIWRLRNTQFNRRLAYRNRNTQTTDFSASRHSKEIRSNEQANRWHLKQYQAAKLQSLE
jgi:hypothetical protein